MVEKQTTRGIETKMFITHRSWKKHTAGLQRPHGEGKAGSQQRERQDIKHTSLLGSRGKEFCCALSKAGLVNLNQKKQGFGKKLHEGLI